MRPRDYPFNRNLVETAQDMRAKRIQPDEGWIYVSPISPATLPDEGGIDVDFSPVFKNGWGNIGGIYPPVRFCLTRTGRVLIEGSCEGGSINTVIFTLPVGYRRDYSKPYIQHSDDGPTSVRVDPNGDVVWIG